jgi:hypothetical protein
MIFCLCVAAISIVVIYKALASYEKEITFLQKVKDVIYYFKPDFIVDNYTVNLVIDDKTLLIQILKDKIIVYCKETAQTYIVATDKKTDIDKSLANIRDNIFLNKDNED